MRHSALMAVIILATVWAPTARAGELTGGLGALERFVGTWQIEAAWSSGGTLWAQSEYRPLLGGRFLEGRTYVRENGGDLYQRYRTILRWDDAAGNVAVHSFNHDGSVSESTLAVDGDEVTSSWQAGATRIDERLSLAPSGETMRWQVWTTRQDGERAQVMDGTWRRVEAPPITLAAPAALDDPVAVLEPYLGGWEIAAAWSDGSPLWSRTEYRPGLGGRFVDATTWTLDAEGAPVQRYETVFAGGGDGTVAYYSFTLDGTLTTGHANPADGGGLDLENAAGTVRQHIARAGDDAFRWQVAVRRDGAFTEVMDGTWRRQQVPPGGAAIDAGRFVPTGADARSFVVEQEIAAPVTDVYRAWTTAEGWADVYPPPAKARIELAVGGAYEWTFNGWLGSNGCQVLSFIPERMVSFSWNAPPSQPDNRLLRTWVVVETESLAPDRTRVRLTHAGFGEGPAWDETRAYFQAAWPRVLERMAATLGGG